MGCSEFVDERGAGHHGLAVDEHGAGAADFFEAIGVVGDGRGGLAGDVDGVERDLAEQRGDVHVGAVGDLEGLRDGRGVRRGLAVDRDFDGACCHACAPEFLRLLTRIGRPDGRWC